MAEASVSPTLPARFYGQVVLDRCPLHSPLDFSQLVTLRPLGTLPEDSWTTLITRIPLIKSVTLPSNTQREFQLTHPCAMLSVWLPGAETLAEAATVFDGCAAAHVLAVALWLSAPCEPIASLVVDSTANEALPRFWGTRPLLITVPAGSAPDYLERIVPGLQADPHMMLLVGMYRDFLLEPHDSPAIVKAWTLLEVASANELGRSVLDKVRHLCTRLNVATDGAVLREVYESSGRDLVKATLLHRNCIAHQGWCNPKSEGCRRSPCRLANLLRLDLQMFLSPFLMDYLGVNGWAVVGPDGVEYESPDGLYESGGGAGDSGPE